MVHAGAFRLVGVRREPDSRPLGAALHAGGVGDGGPGFRTGAATQRGAGPIGLVLKTSASTAHRDRRRIRGSQVVIALQMALCVVLLVTAGLLVRTLQNLESVNLGMKTDGLLVFGISPLARVHSDSEANRFYQGLIARLRSVPGVQSVTVMSNRIGTGWSNDTGAAVDGKPALGENNFAPMRWNVAGPDYFHTMGTPVLLGRDFTDADAESAPRVAIINQTFADRYLSGRSPLGHVVNLNPGPENEFTIVGVVGDSKYTGVREPPRPMAYFPYTQIDGNATLHFEVRTAGNPGTWLPTVRRAVNEYAHGLPLLQPMTQQAQFEQTFSQERLFFRLSMFFGLLAALLVATGLYATLAYSVSRRTSEVGLRMALGAQRGQVLWMVLRGSFLVTLIGVAIGFPLAIAATKVVRSVLFGVTPGDPLTFVGALIGIGLVAFLASLIPAVRAASVDPLVALRYSDSSRRTSSVCWGPGNKSSLFPCFWRPALASRKAAEMRPGPWGRSPVGGSSRFTGDSLSAGSDPRSETPAVHWRAH